MSGLEFSLTARNSSGEQRLIFETLGDGVAVTLVGQYEGQDIQIDFDMLTAAMIEDLIYLLQRRADTLIEALEKQP